jgi:hypothetical protein
MTDEMAKVENDLEQARTELHHTLEQVNQKIEAAGAQLIQPESVFRLFPLLSMCLAGAAGFAAGSGRSRTRIFGAFATGLLAGLIIKRHSSQTTAVHGE